MSAHPIQGRLTPKFYDEIVAAFRDSPKAFAYVSRQLGISVKVATRAWYKGWVESPNYAWARPIKEVLEAEAAARAREVRIAAVAGRVIAAEDSEVGKQRADRRKAEDEENRAVAMARRTALGAGLAAFKILPALTDATKKLTEPGALDDLKPRDVVHLLISYSLAVQRIASAIESVTRAGRLVRGNTPDTELSFETLTNEQAAEELEAAHALVEKLRERRPDGYAGERVVAVGADGTAVLDPAPPEASEGPGEEDSP